MSLQFLWWYQACWQIFWCLHFWLISSGALWFTGFNSLRCEEAKERQSWCGGGCNDRSEWWLVLCQGADPEDQWCSGDFGSIVLFPKLFYAFFWPEFAMQVLGVGRVWEFLIKHVLFKIFFAINIGWYKSDPGTLDDPRKLKKCETAWNCPQHVSFQHDSLCFFNSMTGETECIPFSGNSVGLWLGKLLQEMLYVGYSPAQIGATIRGPYRSPPIFGTSRFEFTSTGASMVLYLRVQVLFLREISWCCGSGVLFVQPKNI